MSFHKGVQYMEVKSETYTVRKQVMRDNLSTSSCGIVAY